MPALCQEMIYLSPGHFINNLTYQPTVRLSSSSFQYMDNQ